MNELELKYGCNPNQKPSRVYMEDGSDLPMEVLNGKPGYINLLDALNGYQLVKELENSTGHVAATSFKHVSPAGAAIGIPLTDVEKKIYWIDDDTELIPQCQCFLPLHTSPGASPPYRHFGISSLSSFSPLLLHPRNGGSRADSPEGESISLAVVR